MPQSLSSVTIHIVFSIKLRRPLITDDIRSRLHAYLSTILRDMASQVYRVGGTEDHVHIACSLPRTLTQSDLLRKIKTITSKWIKEQGIKNFYWQNGYGVFSIGQSQLNHLLKYINNQREHHQNMTFQDEYRELLKKYNIDFDESYVWD